MNDGVGAGAAARDGAAESGDAPGIVPGGIQARYAPPQIS